MSLCELFALGTSSQVPTRFRNHNGYLLRFGDEDYLMDPGEGTQRQMERSGVGVERITRIFMTHFHGDHCLGLASVLHRMHLEKVSHPVHVYYPASGRVFLERQRYAALYDSEVELIEHGIKEEGLVEERDGLKVTTCKLSHGVPTFGFRLEYQKEEGQKPFTLAFVMDTRLCPGSYALAQDADVLISECTYLKSETKEAKDRGHMTATHAAELAQKCSVDHLILTHFSQRYPSNKPFREEALAIHPKVTTLSDTRNYVLAR